MARHLHLHLHHRDEAGPFPWESGHAAPQDRALGLELELIELVRRRDAAAGPDGDRADRARLEAEIDGVLGELDRLVETMPVAV